MVLDTFCCFFATGIGASLLSLGELHGICPVEAIIRVLHTLSLLFNRFDEYYQELIPNLT